MRTTARPRSAGGAGQACVTLRVGAVCVKGFAARAAGISAEPGQRNKPFPPGVLAVQTGTAVNAAQLRRP